MRALRIRDHEHDHSEAGPAFAYPVGLGHRAGHPELVISGLDPDLMHGVLNGVAQRVLDGRRFDHGDVVEDALGRVPPDQNALTCTHVTEKAILWVARESDPSRGEDWTFHCGVGSHEDDDIVVAHLAHLVRAAPSTRAVAALPLDWAARRADVDHEWGTYAL